MIKINRLIKYSILFIIGGILYYSIENLWRGYSHISMFTLGGLCFIMIGMIKEKFFPFTNSLLIQQISACMIITILELMFGLVLNINLGLKVWDYSDLKFNFMGQICLGYSILWFFLSLPTIILYDYLKHWLFKEIKPSYKYL